MSGLPTLPALTRLDRAIAVVSPRRALARFQARTTLSFLTGGSYNSGRSDRRATKDWTPLARGANADTIGDLEPTRARTEDLARNAPIAAGAVRTLVTKTIGTGLHVHPRLDRDALQLTDAQADAWERRMKRIFRAVCASTALDPARRFTFVQQQRQFLYQQLVRGDLAILRRHLPAPDALIATCFQFVEADRVCNPDDEMERPGFMAGVEQDENGRLVRLHIASHHPGDPTFLDPLTWTSVPTRDPSGSMDPLAWLPAWIMRHDQTRGMPIFASAVEVLRQLDQLHSAELTRAAIQALFTVFIKSFNDPLPVPYQATAPLGINGQPPLPEYRLGSGATVRMLPGEEAQFPTPTAPNPNLGAFAELMLEQIGASTEIPFEVLRKRFTASYSASQGANVEMWQATVVRRAWIAEELCDPVYRAVVAEAIARDWIDAPGFFDDPAIRAAWCGSVWVGDAMPQIDQERVVRAAKLRVDAGFSTREREARELTGEDWEELHVQQAKEHRARVRDGLAAAADAAAAGDDTAELNDAADASADDDDIGSEIATLAIGRRRHARA